MKKSFLLAALFLAGAALAQSSVSDMLAGVPARELGPTVMGGRTNDLAVFAKDPRIFYVATAGGGLWKTENGGTTLRPVFFKENTVALGAVEVSQSDPNLVWAGTGEKDSRNSTSWGDGIYKSTDGGETWTNMGLKATRHISRIVLDPTDNNTIYVGGLGELWGPNKDRGVYKSTDGGKTWQLILKGADDLTGCIELRMNPSNPKELIAGMWTRRRYPYRWESGGKGSGIFKTTDGGKTWKPITKGIPEGDKGRIGIDYFRSNPKILVACIEHRGEGGVYRSTDGGESWAKTNSLNPRPFYFSQIRQDPLDENRIYLPAVSFHYSVDAGKTFRALPVSVHVDHHALWINPADSNHMINGNDGGLAQTRDRGLKWEHINNMALGQFYAVAVDMRKPYYVYGGLQDNGSWGGPTQHPINGTVRWTDWYQVGGGDGFHVQVDPEDWRIVYSESQGGAIGRLNQRTGERRSIRPRAPQGEAYRFNWSSPILISPHNSKTIYFGGNKLFKSVNRGDNWNVISPDLSTQDSDRMKNSGGVTPEDTGAERHCTIITISESPIKQGVLWVGTDDGLLHVSQDDGATWSNVTANIPELPKFTWCAKVIASKFVTGRAYVVFDGHRNADFKPYAYVTEDYGVTWKRLAADLPENNSTYTVREGLQNPDLLFLGTELGLYCSIDRGVTWTKFVQGTFGTIRIDDLVIHPRELDLVVGTHGRSIWILPISALEQLTADNRDKDAFLCTPQTAYLLGFTQSGWFGGDREFRSANTQPMARIDYWLKEATEERVSVTISTPGGDSVATLTGSGKAGLNTVTWRPRRGLGSVFVVTLKVGDKTTLTTTLRVEDLSQNLDPNNAIGF